MKNICHTQNSRDNKPVIINGKNSKILDLWQTMFSRLEQVMQENNHLVTWRNSSKNVSMTPRDIGGGLIVK